MALIAIPIGNAADFGGAFRSAFRALTFSAPDALAREPFFALATRADGWGADPFDQVLEDRGLLLMAEGPLEERIRDGINAIDAERLRAHYENREIQADTSLTAADFRTPTVITPVLRLSKPGDAERLVEIAAAVDAALDSLSVRLVRRELSASAFAFVPWIHIAPPLSQELPEKGLFIGPPRIRGGRAVPVLHVGTTPTEWQEQGRVRLIADLLALYGFSRRRDAATWLSPAEWADRDTFHTFVTSFVELPIARTRRRHVLRQLEENVIPLKKELPSALLEKRAEESIRSLNTLINKDDVPIDAFMNGGCPLGISVEITPDRTDFLGIDRLLGTGTLHNAAVNAARDGVGERMKSAANKALAEFREQLRNDEIALENQIRTVLSDDRKTIGEAVDSATRFADLLALALPKAGPATAGMDVEQLLQQVKGRRGAWIAEEEALWEGGSRLPSTTSVVISTLLILLASTLMALLGLNALRRVDAYPAMLVVVPLLIALVPSGLYAWFRMEFVKDYFHEWQRFEERLTNEIRGFADQLWKIANRRVKGLKVASLPGLERAIHAAKVRIRTERAGLLSLIRQEVETASEEEPARPLAGWFRLPTTAVEAKMTQKALTEVRRLMLDIVTLHDWPRPVQVPSHLDTLDRAVKTVTSSEEEDFAAAGNLIRAVVEYARDPRVSLDLDDDRTFTALRKPAIYAFSPNDLRVVVARELGGESTIDPFVPELVVVSNVQSHDVIREESNDIQLDDDALDETETP